MAKKRASSIDVAREAGVSQSAVSRTLTNTKGVSAKTREKVVKAVEKLGYSPNAMARSLITNQSNVIGLVMGEFLNPFYPEVLHVFSTKLQELGRRVMLFKVPPGRDVDVVLPEILQYRPDGVVITSASLSSRMARECARQNTRVVLFNRAVHGAPVWSVCCDNAEGARLIADLLVDAGHERIAYIAGAANTSTNLDREQGFVNRLKERGKRRPIKETGDYTYQGGYDAACKLFERSTKPDAIFCANDIMAIGAMEALRTEFGARVPEDVSVVGFDDTAPADWPSYDLTTIRQRVNLMVDETIRILLEEEPEDAGAPFTRLIAGDLVVRSSMRLPSGMSRGRYPVSNSYRTNTSENTIK